MTVGERIRQLREARKVAQADLAHAVGVRTNRISEIELGKGDPRLQTIARIAEFFGVTLDYLVFGREKE